MILLFIAAAICRNKKNKNLHKVKHNSLKPISKRVKSRLLAPLKNLTKTKLRTDCDEPETEVPATCWRTYSAIVEALTPPRIKLVRKLSKKNIKRKRTDTPKKRRTLKRSYKISKIKRKDLATSWPDFETDCPETFCGTGCNDYYTGIDPAADLEDVTLEDFTEVCIVTEPEEEEEEEEEEDDDTKDDDTKDDDIKDDDTKDDDKKDDDDTGDETTKKDDGFTCISINNILMLTGLALNAIYFVV
jgi:hypothetical protein